MADGGADSSVTVVPVYKVIEWDRCAHVERTYWEVDLLDGRRKRTRTRKEAIEWCADMGYRPEVRR